MNRKTTQASQSFFILQPLALSYGYIVRRVRFAVRAGGAQSETFARAFVFVGAMPRVDADEGGSVARIEMIDESCCRVGDDVETVFASISFERGGQSVEIGAGANLFLRLKQAGEGVESFKTAFSETNARHLPAASRISVEIHRHPNFRLKHGGRQKRRERRRRILDRQRASLQFIFALALICSRGFILVFA